MSAAEIRQLRTDLGLTQAQLGELVGAHSMTVSKWERADGLAPSPYQLELLRQFQQASRDPDVRDKLAAVLVGAGIAAALFLLLRAALRARSTARRKRSPRRG